MDNQNQVVFAFDGDGIGKRHARAILSDDLDQVSQVSQLITAGNNQIKEFVEANGGRWISGGGDEGSFVAPSDFVNLLEQLRQNYADMVQATLSIGYGQTISQAGKALLAAKSRGKDQIVQYDDSVEQEISDAVGNASDPHEEERKKIADVVGGGEDTGEPESVKEGLANQAPDSPNTQGQVLPEGSDSNENEPTESEPPKQDNNHGYDSGYKNSDLKQRDNSYQANDSTPPTIKKPNLIAQPRTFEAVSTDVQESDRKMNEEMPDPKDGEPMDKKPAPKDYRGQAEGSAPQSMAQPQGDKPSDLKYNDTEQLQPQADIPIENSTSDEAENYEQESMGEAQHCPSCTCDQHGDSAEDLLDQNLDNSKDFEDIIDDGQPKTTTDLLDANLDNQQEMLQDMDPDGTSRPADYNQKQGDLGLSEEDANGSDPDLSEVLQGGLDQHADNIQREKVTQLVGHALEGFKSQKAILDKAKDQAPELYDACISMLRAMIELCSLAGLDNSGETEQEVNEIEGQSENPEEQPGSEEMPSDEACPNCGHPHEKEAAPESAAQSPQFKAGS